MSLINSDDDQRWVPTHVQVTVLRGRGLRAKGKHGTSDVYTIIQVGKEKFTTCVVEKTTAPEWKEECSFELLPGVLEAEGKSAYPSGSSELVLTVMHRALIGLDVFLGQAIIALDKVFQERICMRNEWYKLNSKSGKKEKERGEVQVTVQFTRNNLTASMYDLSAKDKPISAFGRLKDRMKGRKREDAESASAVVPSAFGTQPRRRARLPSDGGGEEEYEDDEGGEGRRSKMRNFFLRGKLRKSSDTRSSTSLGSESSESSSRGGSLSPTAGISVVVSDLSNSPSETSNLTADNSPEHTTHPSPKLTTHKRAFSDEVGHITDEAPPPAQPRAVQSLKAQSGVLSQSSLCVNGSHVYTNPAALPANTHTLGLLQKCSPLSRSLQNLPRRADDPVRPPPGAEGRRWSFDKAGREERAAILEPVPALADLPVITMEMAEPAVVEGKKQKRNLFSHGRGDVVGKGAEQSQALPPNEEKHKGWFGSKDSHNKPSLEVSPKVETSSDAVPSHPLTPSPDNHSCTSPASATGLGSPGLAHHANPFTPPPDTPTISPSNPFFTRLQCNPFFVDLLGDHTLKSAPPAPCLSSSPIWPPTVSSSWSDPSPAQDCLEAEPGLAVGVARERSQLGVLGTGARVSPNPFFTSTVSENPSEWDESFEAFAASRLGSQNGSAPPAHTMILPLEPTKEQMSEGSRMIDKMGTEMVSPTLLRRPTKIPVFQGHQSQRFDWTQEPGLNKDLFPPQIDMMSWEHSKKELSGHAPIHSQEDKTGISLFSEWDPEKPLDYSVSSPQFVNMSSLIPQSTSAGQPITSPFSKDYGETLGSDVGRDGVGTPAEQENGSPASALLFRSPEGVRGENDVTWNAPPVFGEEAMYKTTSSPEEVASEVSEILTYEPEVSLVETNPFFTTVPLHKFSEILLEVPESTTTDTLKPMHDAATEQMSTNTNVDLPEVTTHAAHENLHESDAHIFDFTSSLLPNTDAASSLSFTIADNTEINNNSTNELATSHSPFVPEVIMSEMNSEKPDSLFSDELEYSSPADVADLPIKADSPLSVSNEGFLFQSDMSIKAAELPPEESILMVLVEAPAGSPVQVDQEDELEKDGPDREETCAEEAIEKEQSHASTKAQETISQKLDMVLLADTTSDSTLEAGTITLDTQGSDSDLITLGTDSESAHQENCEENADLNVKDSNSPSAEINGCTLSDYLEAREPDPPVSPVPDALNFVTAIEDPDPGNGWESHDALSAKTGIKHLQLKDDACETSLLEEGGFAPSLFVTADSSTAANESVQLEEPHNNSNESLLPPPKPPRLFQDSVLNEEHMNEYPHPGSGDEAEFKHLGTPKDSPSDLLQTPEVNSGPELQLTSPSPFPSDYSLFSTAPKVEWEKQNRTFTFMEDELSSRKVPQSSFSAFDLEENSDQSWVTSKSFFKELDTTHFAVWSADEENAILTDSTFLDKAILMEDSTQKEPLPDAGTQPTTSTGSCSPSQKLNEELGESFLDLLKGTKQQTWTESVEPTWQSLPSLSELCSTVSQDPVRDLAPEDLLQPSKPFSGFDIVSLPKGIESTIEPKEELPAEVASTLRSHPSIGVNPKSSLFLHDCNPQASSTPSLLAETNAQVAFFPSPILPLLPSRPTTGTTSIAPPSKPPAMIDTPFMLLPQETQSADGLPSGQQSSPHPVKPLTSAAPQEEKKSEGRSVLVSGLEKLKSTIHPGRAAQQGEPEADRNKALSEGVAPYYHLSHNELVALLLQREAELERQGAEFERQGALLEKREVELKKMKHQTRDLEDYIDTLLVRIMEQTPTLLQVRSKLK